MSYLFLSIILRFIWFSIIHLESPFLILPMRERGEICCFFLPLRFVWNRTSRAHGKKLLGMNEMAKYTNTHANGKDLEQFAFRKIYKHIYLALFGWSQSNTRALQLYVECVAVDEEWRLFNLDNEFWKNPNTHDTRI